MRSLNVLLVSTLVLFAGRSYAKFEAHEWGTFTSVVDSTGVTQNGMYHEDEVLPGFVHPFGELRAELPPPRPGTSPRPPIPMPNPGPVTPCRSKICFDQFELQKNIITQKMETPVIYFYADQAQTVHVDVKFPEGVITETYPGPISTFPTMNDPHIVGNGSTQFALTILASKTGAVPAVEAGNIYGHARVVNSNLISSGAEQEKFLFYRGLGRFQPQISITSKDGQLKISGLAKARPQAAFLIHVNESGDGQMLSLDGVKTKEEVTVLAKRIAQLKDHSQTAPYIIKGQQARGKMIDELIVSGLYKDEAEAMINTWENGYLKVPGLRMLYILPRSEVDKVLPLTINPAPEKLVRSFVGRMEILLDTDEQKVLQEIITQQDRFQARSLGRFAEPILHRMRALAVQSQGVSSSLVTLIDRLIQDAAVNFTASGTVN
jgi:hypothetical protein